VKFSIITVALNSAETILATLQSVGDQHHADLEHIVIDGGSIDATVDIVRNQGSRVSAWITEPDRGIYDAMNKGVQRAHGEIIAFLNADDVYAHGNVLTLVESYFDCPDVDMVYGDVDFFRPSNSKRAIRHYRSGHFHERKLAWGWMPAHPALFVRANVFHEVGPFRTDYRIAGDYEWLIRALLGGEKRKCRHIPAVLVHMRTGGVSTAGWRNTLTLNREVIRACRENGLKTSWPMILSKYPRKVLEFLR